MWMRSSPKSPADPVREPVLPPREIFDSAEKLAGMFFLLAFFMIGALVGAFNGDLIQRVLYWLVLLGLLAWSGSLLMRMLLIKAPIVVLDTAGVFDRRLSQDIIPWRIVISVTPVEGRRGAGGGARLAIRREHIRKLRLEPLPRFFRWLQSRDEINGLFVSTSGVALPSGRLGELCLAYSRHHEMQDAPANV
jgi:hypothetical protein